MKEIAWLLLRGSALNNSFTFLGRRDKGRIYILVTIGFAYTSKQRMLIRANCEDLRPMVCFRIQCFILLYSGLLE